MSDMPIIVAAQPRFEASGESVARHEEEVLLYHFKNKNKLYSPDCKKVLSI
jgi:hypothetical protein